MKQYVFKTDKAYKVNPEVIIAVTVLQSYRIKSKFPIAGDMNISIPNCSIIVI
jgi:hypothetical protein